MIFLNLGNMTGFYPVVMAIAYFQQDLAQLRCLKCEFWVGMAPKKTPVPSKQWSCSELTDGHQHLMNVKLETNGKQQLALEIQEPHQHNVEACCIFLNTSWWNKQIYLPQLNKHTYPLMLSPKEYERKIELLKKAAAETTDPCPKYGKLEGHIPHTHICV